MEEEINDQIDMYVARVLPFNGENEDERMMLKTMFEKVALMGGQRVLTELQKQRKESELNFSYTKI